MRKTEKYEKIGVLDDGVSVALLKEGCKLAVSEFEGPRIMIFDKKEPVDILVSWAKVTQTETADSSEIELSYETRA